VFADLGVMLSPPGARLGLVVANWDVMLSPPGARLGLVVANWDVMLSPPGARLEREEMDRIKAEIRGMAEAKG
jgi:hypothetical protein